MPTYTFRNKNTNDYHEMFMKMAERDQYVVDNPDLEQCITEAPTIGDSVKLGIKKPDSSFRDVLKEIKGKHDAKYTRSTINTF
jgi:hypothetical protein